MSAKKPIESGAESIVYSLTNSDGSVYIVKNRQPKGKVHYRFEAYLYEKLYQLGARVPQVVSVNDDELVMTALQGETIDDRTDLFGDSAIFQKAADDLLLSRKLTFQGYGPAALVDGEYVGESKSWNEFLNSTLAVLETSTLLSPAQKEVLLEYWKKVAPAIRLNEGMLVHGDFALSAIFVHNNKYEGIIDYGDAFIGDPLMDLAYFRFKEMTKDYGYEIYSLLKNSYVKNLDIDDETLERIIVFYMVYWAVVRVHADNLDVALIEKFIDKTEALIAYITLQASR